MEEGEGGGTGEICGGGGIGIGLNEYGRAFHPVTVKITATTTTLATFICSSVCLSIYLSTYLTSYLHAYLFYVVCLFTNLSPVVLDMVRVRTCGVRGCMSQKAWCASQELGLP